MSLKARLALVLLAACLWPAAAWAKVATVIEIQFRPAQPAPGQTVSLDVLIYGRGAAGAKIRPRGGVLVVSILNAREQSLVRTYTASPDGRTDVYELSWRPTSEARFNIEASYGGTAEFSAAQTTKSIEVSALPLRPAPTTTTTTLPPPTTTTTTSTSRPTTTTTTTTSRPTTTTTTTTTTLPPPPPTTAAKPPARGRPASLETTVQLSAGKGASPNTYVIIVLVTTKDGHQVEEGDVLVTVSGGQLEPGRSGQALVSAAAGRQELLWTAPKSQSKKNYRLEAAYFGAKGHYGEYKPASAALTLPPKP